MVTQTKRRKNMKKLLIGLMLLTSVSAFAGAKVDASKMVSDTCKILMTKKHKVYSGALKICNEPNLEKNLEHFSLRVWAMLQSLHNASSQAWNEGDFSFSVKAFQEEVVFPLRDAGRIIDKQVNALKKVANAATGLRLAIAARLCKNAAGSCGSELRIAINNAIEAGVSEDLILSKVKSNLNKK